MTFIDLKNEKYDATLISILKDYTKLLSDNIEIDIVNEVLLGINLLLKGSNTYKNIFKCIGIEILIDLTEHKNLGLAEYADKLLNVYYKDLVSEE